MAFSGEVANYKQLNIASVCRRTDDYPETQGLSEASVWLWATRRCNMVDAVDKDPLPSFKSNKNHPLNLSS